ncbi:hypothetical protein B0H34DRAFT_803399 [Crassisporium funariophilum]|nr:hypothetical protein B0H34DRAFT_803399 [Crassisporium funariophilum]
MDRLKWLNRERIPKYTIATGLSTTQLTFVPHSTTEDPVVHNTLMQKTNNRVQQGFNVLSSITAAIPVAGTPLKVSIDALLIVLNGLNTRDGNREITAYLIRRLYHLETAISSVPPVTPLAQYHRDDLARKLDVVSGRLKGAPPNWTDGVESAQARGSS